jgi:hypothetical protein
MRALILWLKSKVDPAGMRDEHPWPAASPPARETRPIRCCLGRNRLTRPGTLAGVQTMKTMTPSKLLRLMRELGISRPFTHAVP